jgi:CHAD domain-containing protein
VTHAPPIYTRDVTALVAAQQIMTVQYQIMNDKAEAARRQPEREPIHDLRVAINRLRSALNLFQPLLAAAPVRSTERALRDVRALIGPARDAQLWVIFLNRVLHETNAPQDSPLQQYVFDETTKMELALADTQDALTHASFKALCRQLSALLEKDLPSLADASSDRFAPFAAKRLKKRFKSVLAAAPADLENISSEEMHQVRKQCKHLRYWAEFAVPVLDKSISDLALRAKAVTSAFGVVHDLDVQHQLLKRSGFAKHTILADALRKARKTSCRDAGKAWAILHKPTFMKAVHSSLRHATCID